MIKIIYPGNCSGIIDAPASKSYLQRALAIAALAKGESIIRGYSSSKDAAAAVQIINTLGAATKIKGDTICVTGVRGIQNEITLECNEAGLSIRMFSPIAAVLCKRVRMHGSGSLLFRPMQMISSALEQCGVKVFTTNGKLPIEIEGRLQPGEVSIDGSETSQLLTGLLIALSQITGTSTLHVKNLKSIPYIMMTIETMNHFGLYVKQVDSETYIISGKQSVLPKIYKVEGDWSAASIHLVAAAIAGEITVRNLNSESLQADIAILNALKDCGASVMVSEETVKVKKNKLVSFSFDITHCPDLFPALAVLAANCHGTSFISGIHRLANKESNRLITIQKEFKKLGITVTVKNDTAIIRGGIISGGEVQSHNDHRIAMAMTIMALKAATPIKILEAEAVQKSYPMFFHDFSNVFQAPTFRSSNYSI